MIPTATANLTATALPHEVGLVRFQLIDRRIQISDQNHTREISTYELVNETSDYVYGRLFASMFDKDGVKLSDTSLQFRLIPGGATALRFITPDISEGLHPVSITPPELRNVGYVPASQIRELDENEVLVNGEGLVKNLTDQTRLLWRICETPWQNPSSNELDHLLDVDIERHMVKTHGVTFQTWFFENTIDYKLKPFASERHLVFPFCRYIERFE